MIPRHGNDQEGTRDNVRSMRGRWCGAVIAVLLLAPGCGKPEGPPSARTTSTAAGDLAQWPDVETENMDCVLKYPDDLAARDDAFSGRIESVELGEYDEDAGARPALISFRVEEVFRGIFHGDYLVLDTWDFMLPKEDITGARVLAASDTTGDLMGCGFTRPYSPRDARLWRQTFADLPPEDCGAEVRDCDLGEPTPIPAGCNRASFEYAIYSGIDAGSYPIDVIACNERYLSLQVDLGDCPPEATKQALRECARKKTAYFKLKGARWDLLTYEDQTRCSGIQSIEPGFPSDFC